MPKYLSKFVVFVVVLLVAGATRNSPDFVRQNNERAAETLCARLYELEPTFAQILRRRSIVANKDYVARSRVMQLIENYAKRYRIPKANKSTSFFRRATKFTVPWSLLE